MTEIIGEDVQVNELTKRIMHVLGHTMQVDWAGTKMAIFDPVTGAKTGSSGSGVRSGDAAVMR